MEHALQNIVQKHKRGHPVGIYSICSSHPFVLEAAMLQAEKDNSGLLIESTSNQVDQFGGYTGMKPKDFVNYVKDICTRMHFPFERVILGGDHLGPNVWQDQPSTKAMAFALEQIKAYAEAGYTKIHLDTSMRCADDPGDPGSALSTEIIAERAARLCVQSESTVKNKPGPVYIIGTEVPIPGGAQEELHELKPTSTHDLNLLVTELTKMKFWA